MCGLVCGPLDVAESGWEILPEHLKTYLEMLRQWSRFDLVMSGGDR